MKDDCLEAELQERKNTQLPPISIFLKILRMLMIPIVNQIQVVNHLQCLSKVTYTMILLLYI